MHMPCPYCGSENNYVTDSRYRPELRSIYRRRKCADCGKRYKTREKIILEPKDEP